jgi:hypothetical protein
LTTGEFHGEGRIDRERERGREGERKTGETGRLGRRGDWGDGGDREKGR